MKNYIDIYSQRFIRSKSIFERYRSVFPKGVSHDIRFFPPYPFVVEKCEASHILTVDGIDLVDMWMVHYTNILGHANPEIVEVVSNVARKGLQIGIVNEYQLYLAEKIRSAVPEMEMLRFCTSGTEATMYVTRVARKFTGRSIVAKIEGGWHGGNTDLSFDVKPPYHKVKGNIVSIPFNDIERSLEILDQFKDDIAAVILEPVLGAGGGVVADKDYLIGIRRFCDDNSSLLIYDETITGFRFRFGSIWPILGVKPDLFTMGKIIGGGFAIGAYGGLKSVMQTIEKGEIITGGGTFSEHVITMAAGLKTLEILETADYNFLNNLGDRLRNFLVDVIPDSINAFVSGFGSMIALHFCKNKEIDKTRPSTFLNEVDIEKENIFKILMILNGVFTMHSGGCITFAHSDEDIKIIFEAYKKSFEQLIDG